MPICKGARLKIERADHHIANLEARIGFLKEHLLCTAHVNPDTGCEFIKCDFAGVENTDIPSQLAVIIGDAVHNLKSALDHVWFETTARLIPAGKRVPRDRWRKSMFPAYPAPNYLKDALQGLQIHCTAPNFFDFLVNEVQPYDGGNFAVWPVHKLDLRDKHRLLTPVIHYSSIGGIQTEEKGEMWPGFTWGTYRPLPHFIYFKEGIHVKNPGRASFDVMFEDGDGCEARADTLPIYSRETSRIVVMLEAFTETV